MDGSLEGVGRMRGVKAAGRSGVKYLVAMCRVSATKRGNRERPQKAFGACPFLSAAAASLYRLSAASDKSHTFVTIRRGGSPDARRARGPRCSCPLLVRASGALPAHLVPSHARGERGPPPLDDAIPAPIRRDSTRPHCASWR